MNIFKKKKKKRKRNISNCRRLKFYHNIEEPLNQFYRHSILYLYEALPGITGNREIMSFQSGEQGNTSPEMKGTGEQINLEEQGIYKINILILENKEKCRNISGEQGNRSPWEGLLYVMDTLTRSITLSKFWKGVRMERICCMERLLPEGTNSFLIS